MIKVHQINKNWVVLLCALFFVYAFLMVRNLGLYSFVFPDEYIYSTSSRLIPLSRAVIPDYLYYAIFSITKACGDGSLECARLLNSVLFVSASLFIYSICKNVAGHKTALLVAVSSALLPASSYTAYFMPESLYYSVFWMFTYCLYRYRQEICPRRMILLGAVVGLLSLVKPHALLLMPALLVYFWAYARHSEKDGPSMRIRLLLYFAITVLSVKLLLGFALAGVNGFCLFGPDYSTGVTDSVSVQGNYLNLIENAAMNIQGHITAMCLLFSVPTAYLVLCGVRSVAVGRTGCNDAIAAYTSLVLASLLIVVALFTAATAGTGPYEITNRLHGRYYSFIFPLLFIISASQVNRQIPEAGLKWRVLAALPVGAAILYATYSRMSPYYFSLTDSPELLGITASTTSFYVFCGLSFFSLVLWAFSPRAGASFFLYLLVPVFVVVSGLGVTKEMHARRTPDLYDKAGMFARHYLSRDDRSRVVVVGSDKYKLYRSLLYLDNVSASLEIVPVGTVYDASQLPEGKDWALVIGDHPVPDNVFYKITMNGYTLVRARKPDKLSFTTDNLPGVILGVRGLGPPEAFGRLSTGKEVEIEFCEPLPEHFRLTMVAYAVGPNVGRVFRVSTSSSTREIALGASPAERVLVIDNPERSRLIKLIIPQPVSSRMLGIAGDERQLGLGLVELRID